MIKKVAGGIMFFVGLLCVVFVPDMLDIQTEKFSGGGVFFGLILMGIGLYLMAS